MAFIFCSVVLKFVFVSFWLAVYAVYLFSFSSWFECLFVDSLVCCFSQAVWRVVCLVVRLVCFALFISLFVWWVGWVDGLVVGGPLGLLFAVESRFYENGSKVQHEL